MSQSATAILRGFFLGYVPLSERAGLDSVEDAREGQPMTDVGNRVVWFKR